VYAMLTREIPKAEAEVTAATGKKCFTILAGDWNAALLTGDRNVMTTRDKAHQHLMDTLGMTPTEIAGSTKRAATHHPGAENLQDSRIDDILVTKQLIENQLCRNEVICGTGDSDHSAIMTSIPLNNMLLIKPGPDIQPLSRPAKLKTPVNQKQLAAFKEAFGIETDPLTVMLNRELDDVIQQINMLQDREPSCKGLIDSLVDQGINPQTTEALSEKTAANTTTSSSNCTNYMRLH